MALLESKISATHRLQREDRWDLASRYRDSERLRLRADGKTRAEARESSWQRMIEKFQPVDESAGTWPQLVETCPPLLSNGEAQPALNAVWSPVWQVISFVADQDADLRSSLAGCDEKSAERLWWLRRELTPDRRLATENRCPTTQQTAGELTFPEPTPLLRWAEPILLDSEVVEPEGEYSRLSRLYFEKLVASLPAVVEAIHVFWPSDVLQQGGRPER